jgi:hypothetical protein
MADIAAIAKLRRSTQNPKPIASTACWTGARAALAEREAESERALTETPSCTSRSQAAPHQARNVINAKTVARIGV